LLQEKIRGEQFDEYVELLQNGIRQEKNLEFLKSTQNSLDHFKHCGFATRSNYMPKLTDANSINKPSKPMGFATEEPSAPPPKKKTNDVESTTVDVYVKDAWKKDPRQVAEIYVQKVCLDYNSTYHPTLNEQIEEEGRKLAMLRSMKEKQNNPGSSRGKISDRDNKNSYPASPDESFRNPSQTYRPWSRKPKLK
jgi:hypothetical protein